MWHRFATVTIVQNLVAAPRPTIQAEPAPHPSIQPAPHPIRFHLFRRIRLPVVVARGRGEGPLAEEGLASTGEALSPPCCCLAWRLLE
jgi:hypothetical protein